MGENDVIRQREFDRYREDVNRRLADLERDVAALENEHENDMRAITTQRTTELQQAGQNRLRHREWTWAQVVGAIAAAAAVAGFWLNAIRR